MRRSSRSSASRKSRSSAKRMPNVCTHVQRGISSAQPGGISSSHAKPSKRATGRSATYASDPSASTARSSCSRRGGGTPLEGWTGGDLPRKSAGLLAAAVGETHPRLHPTLDQLADHPQAVHGRELLALAASARLVAHRYLVDLIAAGEHLARDLRLDVEARRAEVQGPEDVGSHHLVAGHDVREPRVEQEVGDESDTFVAHHIPEAERRMRLEAARPEDDVDLVLDQGLEQLAEVARVVLEVGVHDR